MCDYCGCQRNPVIAQLTREHDEIRAVVRDARLAAQCGDRAAAVLATSQLLALLAPHTEVEERGLFPAMAVDFEDHVESLLADHRHLEQRLALVLHGGADGTWPRTLLGALEGLFDHILREQDGLFPAALATLSAPAWDRLQAVNDAVHASS